MDYLFNTSFGLKLNADQVIQEAINFMKSDADKHYKVIIGTDSEAGRNKTADFVTALVIYRVGNGGRYFWRRVYEPDDKFHTLRDRILNEVLISLDVAKAMLKILQQSAMPANWDFEIHVDIGENGATKNMIQELVGMIRANNFNVKTKPDSYAATKVADRHV